MFNISNNGIITVNRGDTFTLNVFVNLGTVLEPIQYFLENGDKLYFALMESDQHFETALIREEFTSADANEDGLIVMNFPTEMTEKLMPGRYYYMVKLRKANNEVDTIINKTRFILMD